MNINQTTGVYNNRHCIIQMYTSELTNYKARRIFLLRDHAMGIHIASADRVLFAKKNGHCEKMTKGDTVSQSSSHSLETDRNSPEATCLLATSDSEPISWSGRTRVCELIPESTFVLYFRCQSFQEEIQNLCISWPRSENEEETVKKGKPTNVGSYIRQSILLRHVIYSFSSSHVISTALWHAQSECGTKTEVLHTCTPPIHHRWSRGPWV